MILPIGEYEIPEDCTVQVSHRVVYVVRKLPRGPKKRYRKKCCRDCQHRVEGYVTNTSTYKTKVCELRPKVVWSWNKKRETYYAAEEYDPICDKFIDKEIEV